MKKIIIEYCIVWNYYPRAASLAEKLQEHFSYPVELHKDRDGRFEIKFNDKLIFSKKRLARFPLEDEIVELIKENE